MLFHEYILANLDLLAKHSIKYRVIDPDAVVLYVDGARVLVDTVGYTLKTRTARGGWEASAQIELFENNHSCAKDLTSLIRLLVNFRPPPRVKRESKVDLGPPYTFSSQTYYIHDKVVVSTSVINSCKAIGVVSIANNRKLIPADKPNSSAWFLVEIKYASSGVLRIVYNGDGYYAVNRRSGKAVSVYTPHSSKLNAVDKQLIDAAVAAYAGDV